MLMQPALCPAELITAASALGCKGKHTHQWEGLLLCPHTCSCAQAPAQQLGSLTTPLMCPGPLLKHVGTTCEVMTAGDVPQGLTRTMGGEVTQPRSSEDNWPQRKMKNSL